MKSTREDKRGHWPRGKRRNRDAGNWQRIRLALTRFIDNNWQQYGKISYRQLAGELGVSDRTVRRWITNTHRPPVDMQEAIEQWLLDRRKELQEQRR